MEDLNWDNWENDLKKSIEAREQIWKGGKRTGFYSNTAENRSKHRVGQKYKKDPSVKGGEKENRLKVGDKVQFSWTDNTYQKHTIYPTLTRVTAKRGYWKVGNEEESALLSKMKTVGSKTENQHTVEYSKENKTYQIKKDGKLVNDFAVKENADKEASRLNKLNEAKELDKKQEDNHLNKYGVHKGYLSILPKLDIAHKPAGRFNEHSFTTAKNFNKEEKHYLSTLEVVDNPTKGEIPEDSPNTSLEEYILKDGDDTYYVDTQGYDYPRYIAKIKLPE